jgi:hypothetical protein
VGAAASHPIRRDGGREADAVLSLSFRIAV